MPPAEHYREDGTLAQGYYCSRCGAPGVNMLASGHGHGRCPPNPELIAKLRKMNEIKLRERIERGQT